MTDDKLQTLAKVLGIPATVLAAAHIISPELGIDNTTVLLLLIGAFPWLLPHIKSLKLTGVGEIEFRQALQDMKAEIASIGTKVTETTETVAATQSAIINGVGKSSLFMGWEGSTRSLVEDSQSVIKGDPHKGQFGGSSERNGRCLTASVREVKGNPELFEISLSVDRTGNHKLVDGQIVTFYLHPTFRPPTVSVDVRNGKATLKRYAWGAFTVGAVVEREKLRLELDLADLPDAPAHFRSR